MDIVRGERYTAAFLDDGRCGLAFSFSHLLSPAEQNLPLVLTLPRPAENLLALFGSSAMGDRAIATAAANAILNSEGEPSGVQPDPRDESQMLMVGLIAPLEKHLASLGRHTLIVDDAFPDSLPLDRTEKLASKSELLILSASSVVNGSWSSLSVAAGVIAKSLTSPFSNRGPLAGILCVGGIHFEHSFSEAAMNVDHPFGISHILPNQWIVSGDYGSEEGYGKLKSAAECIRGGVRAVVYHEGIKAPYRDQCRRLGGEIGVPVLKHKALRKPEDLSIW